MSDDATVWVMLTVRPPPGLSTASGLPVTVTVWGLAQSAGLKVSVAGTAVATAVSLLATVMVTSALGCWSSTTV